MSETLPPKPPPPPAPPPPPNRYIEGWFGSAERANKRLEAQWQKDLEEWRERQMMSYTINPPPTTPRPDVTPVPQHGYQPTNGKDINPSDLPQGGTGQSDVPKPVETPKPGRILEL